MTCRTRTRRLTPPTPFWVAALFVAASLLAGCAAGQKRSAGDDNDPPVADLKAEKSIGWTTEQFTFDASGSNDPDGNITTYKFDFGDNAFVEKGQHQEPKADHRYTQGGEYTVTLTVTDNGAEKSGSLSAAASANIAVNERVQVVSQAIQAAPSGGASVNSSTPFEVHPGVDRMEADIDVRNTLLVGSTEIVVRVRDPSGDVLDEETRTIPANQNVTINLSSPLTQEGDYRIDAEAKSGSGLVEGEVRVFYDAGY